MKNSLLGVLFIGFLVLLLVSFSPSTVRSKGYKIGDSVADFKLKNTITGNELSLSDYGTAKGFVIVFTCNHCPCSAKYEDRILALDKKYKPLGYPVIAINSIDIEQYPTETQSRMRARAVHKKYSFPYLHDDSQQVAVAFGAASTPYVYVLQKTEKVLVLKYSGAIDDNMQEPSAVKEHFVENTVNLLLEGKPVLISTTTPYGCSINIRKKALK